MSILSKNLLMKSFTFFLAQDIDPKICRSSFFQRSFVKRCITAKEVLMDRHSMLQIIDFVQKKNFILITKNKNALNHGKKLYRSIVFLNGDLKMKMLQHMLETKADKIHTWLLLDDALTYTINSTIVPNKLNLRGIEK